MKWVAALLFASSIWLPVASVASDAIARSGHSVHLKVEDFFNYGSRHLTAERSPSASYDRRLNQSGVSTFSEAISTEILDAASDRSPDLNNWFLNQFDVPRAMGGETVSLVGTPICEHSRSDMRKLMPNGRYVTDRELALINQFAETHNKAIGTIGNDPPEPQALAHWSAFFGCLAYTESLGDPDTTDSRRVARRLLGSNYRKPDGVKFYFDARHSNPRSQWNVGLYQFVLHSGGNIAPCRKGWNASQRTTKKVPRNDEKGVANFMASGGQTLNAYCGVHKLLETFFIQKHTTNPARTHPSNLVNGRLKPAKDRCVSPHAKKAYMHFGPLIRSDGSHRGGFTSNLDKLLQCTMAVL